MSDTKETKNALMKSPVKVIGIALGSIFAISHIGLLGYVVRQDPKQKIEPPAFNIPHGPYSSYKIKASKDGYEIEFRSDDPKILESTRSLDLDKEKNGWFGGGREQRSEFSNHQYTREGSKNLGGAINAEGKSAKDVECLLADAGAQSQGAMAGAAISSGVLVPAVMNIPYIGWLAAGWASLLGNNVGSSIGSEVNSILNDC